MCWFLIINAQTTILDVEDVLPELATQLSVLGSFADSLEALTATYAPLNTKIATTTFLVLVSPPLPPLQYDRAEAVVSAGEYWNRCCRSLLRMREG